MKNLLFTSLLLVFFNVAAFAQQPANPVASPTPQGARRPPQAKTHAEFNDYNTAYAITGGAAMEKAADDFAAKYPTSELRPFLYSKAMHEYQTENNPPKILAMGDKVLSLDPDNTVALVMTATVLSDMLGDPAQANDQKVADIRKNAGRALQTIDSSFVAPAGATADQIASYKNMLQAMAHSALGITDLKMGDDAGAEKELRTAADLGKAQPDAYVWYHLALAQDHQKKYTEALASIDQALKYVQPTADLAKLAAGERTRLQTLTGTAPSGQQPPANSSQPPL